jgi:hypothetical protein
MRDHLEHADVTDERPGKTPRKARGYEHRERCRGRIAQRREGAQRKRAGEQYVRR